MRRRCGGWYRRPSPFGAALAPALLFHSEVYKNLNWYLPNLIGNLHAKQEWELFHPMLVGDNVRTRSTVVERYVKRNREYVVNEVVITDAGGRWLQRSRTHQSFLLDQHSSSPANSSVSGGGQEGAFVVDKDREKRPERTFTVGEGPGADLAPAEKTITLTMCQAFSGPQRNYQTDREMAQALGFPDIVVQGMMSVCFISDVLTARLGLGWHCGGKLDVRLVNVVWAGDTLTTRGKIRERVREGTRERVVLDVWCEKADGTVTTVGTASAIE